MDACAAVDRDVTKVIEKFNNLKSSIVRHCDDAYSKLDNIRDVLTANPEASMSVAEVFRLTGAVNGAKEMAQKVAAQHRDLHNAVSKVGKAIDRNFSADYGAATGECAFTSPDCQAHLNQGIYNHFLQQGLLDIAENLVEETGVNQDPEKKKPFVELKRITEALKDKELGPALEWALVHRDILLKKGSHLEFKLQKLRFLQILETEGRANALHYARSNFNFFAESDRRGIQELMGALVYLDANRETGKITSKNPHYQYLIADNAWFEVVSLFAKEAGAIQGFSVTSPLAVCVNAGCKALPALLNIKQVMQQRLSSGYWTSKEELPIEINLGKEGDFHSLFACPILRQETTELNPPMRLVCGHAISRDALIKLTSGNKLKCPYCPMEQSPGDAKEVYF